MLKNGKSKEREKTPARELYKLKNAVLRQAWTDQKRDFFADKDF